MSEKSLKILTVVAGTFLGTAILLLVVDYQLKNAIIKEAEILRRVLRGQRYAGSNGLRNSSDDYWNGPFPADMVGRRDAGMEEAGDNSSPSAPGSGEGWTYSATEDGNS